MLMKMKGSNDFSSTKEMKMNMKMMTIKIMMIQIKHWIELILDVS